MLLVLISLKALETSSDRDFTVLTLLGYFLGLCALFFSQEMNRWLFVGLTTTLLTAAMVQLHHAGGTHPFFRSLRLSGVMLAQALPLVLLLFVFCPRPHSEFHVFPGSAAQASAGMSEHLRPGSISGVATSTEEAFRAGFPQGDLPPPRSLYWRSLVLWGGEGLVWERWDRHHPVYGSGRDPGRGPALRQKIVLRPHQGRWLVALDRPVDAPRLATFETDGTLRAYRPVNSRTSFEVTSRLVSGETVLPPAQRLAALQRPARVSAEVQALADSLAAGAANEREVAERALEYFHHGGFKYSIEPGLYPSGELDEFLFHRRIGFCEHYAAAFATLMRLAGVPSRIIGGYLGGEYNEIGGYFVVPESDAHAWCEIWMQGQGWVRVDPTSVIAPDRISQGIERYLAGQQPGGHGAERRLPGSEAWGRLLRQSSMFWDNLSYQWDVRVLTYNIDAQQNFYITIGLGKWQPPQISLAVTLAGLLITAALVWWLRRSARPADPAVRAFAKLRQTGRRGRARTRARRSTTRLYRAPRPRLSRPGGKPASRRGALQRQPLRPGNRPARRSDRSHPPHWPPAPKARRGKVVYPSISVHPVG